MVILVCTVEGIQMMQYEPMQYEPERSVGLQSTKRSLEEPEKAPKLKSGKNAVCQRVTNLLLAVGVHRARTKKSRLKEVGNFLRYRSCFHRYVFSVSPVCFSLVTYILFDVKFSAAKETTQVSCDIACYCA